VTLVAIRTLLSGSKLLLVVELGLAGVILAFGFAGVLPFNATPFLLAWGAVLLWLRGEGVRGVGLERRTSTAHTLALAAIAGVAYQLLSLYVVEPLVARITGDLPDVSLFTPLIGNTRFLLLSLAVTWTLAAFGEEFVYRGYLLNRLAQLFGSRKAGWVVALVLTSVLFGLGHRYQGLSGIVTTGLNGLIFGLLYLASKRNLWVPILAHGSSNTVGFLLIYTGSYPGL
jgi:membrane protease YdiL (CAAX protease family)